MSRTLRLMSCLLLTLTLAAAPAALASPADTAPSPWWTAASDLWVRVFAAASTDDGSNMGPYIDPDGIAMSDPDGDDGNIGPYIDPNGLTAPRQDGGTRGPYLAPDGLEVGREAGPKG